jgi:hypothetical protein
VLQLEEDSPKKQKSERDWNEMLIDFINSEGGSYQDKKWQIEYYNEYKVIGLGDNQQRRVTDGKSLMMRKLPKLTDDSEW